MPKALKAILFIICLIIFILLLVVQIKSCNKASALGIDYTNNNTYTYSNTDNDVFQDIIAYDFAWTRYYTTVNGVAYNQNMAFRQYYPFTYELDFDRDVKRCLKIGDGTNQEVYLKLERNSTATISTALDCTYYTYLGSPQQSTSKLSVPYTVTAKVYGNVDSELSDNTIANSAYKFYCVQYNLLSVDNNTGGYYITFTVMNTGTNELHTFSVSFRFDVNLPSGQAIQFIELFTNSPTSRLYELYAKTNSLRPMNYTAPKIYLDNYKLYNAYQQGYTEGDGVGYKRGYRQGLTDADNPTNTATNFFTSLASILDINIFPNFTIGTLLTFIVGLAMLTFIIKFIKG